MTIEERVAADRFIGYEQRASRRLYMMLPHEERGGIESDVRLYALEAARLFDPTRGAKFTTFLFIHLNNRTRTQISKCWSKRRRPRGGFAELRDVGYRQPPTSEITELRRNVSKNTLELLDVALEGNSEALREAFCSRYYKHRVGELLGLPKQQIQMAVSELRRAIPKHITMGV